MSYHDRIMNIPIDDGFSSHHKDGHRMARNAAAEIAAEADAEIERLREENEVLRAKNKVR